MEITKIRLTNIRCFKDFEVDLSNGDGAKKWLMILGENGVGKTTLLRSIALGLCEESGASGLCAEIPGEWIKNGEKTGTIRIDLKPYKGYNKEAYILTSLTKSNYGETILKQQTYPPNPPDFKWEKLFVCAYGSARSVYGSMDVSEYAIVDSVYTLFNYDSDLQNPELCLRRIQDEQKNIKPLLNKLENVLMVDKNSITLSRTGISVTGPWGESMSIGVLGDGYKSTITWLLDLYGWKLLCDEHLTNLEPDGIIILDEMEKHLHPKWQKQLVKLLSDQFPNLQFITSTHSPLCVIGTTDLEDAQCCIAVSKQGEDSVYTEQTKPPRHKRADQVLTSYLFDLYTTSDNKIKQQIGRYNYLYRKEDKTQEEKQELEALFSDLNQTLSSGETELEKKVSEVLSKSLNILFMDEIQNDSREKSPENFELLRQLKELL